MKTFILIAKLLVITGIIVLYGFSKFTANTKTVKCPDLVIKEIFEPRFDHSFDASLIDVQFENVGDTISLETKAKISDMDSVLIDNKMEFDGDNDEYFEDIRTVPSLKPKQTITITFIIYNHWVYDPNCEMEVEVDIGNLVKECNEKNNKSHYFAGG